MSCISLPRMPQHLAVGVDRDLDRPVLIALLRRIGEMLAAVLDPFDRAAQQASRPRPRRRPRDRRRVLGRSRRRRRAWRRAAGFRRDRSVRSALASDRAPSASRPRRHASRGRRFARGCRGLRSECAAPRCCPEVLVHDMGGLGECRVAVAVSDLVGDDPVRRQLAAHRRARARPRQSATAGSTS